MALLEIIRFKMIQVRIRVSRLKNQVTLSVILQKIHTHYNLYNILP